MDYIISPMWFYCLHLINNLSATICAVSCVIFIITVCIFFVAFIQNMDQYEDDFCKSFFQTKTSKTAIKFFIISMILFLIYIILPDQNTLIQMKLAEFGTYDNIEKIIEQIIAAADYIVNKGG